MSKRTRSEEWTHATIRLFACAIVFVGCRSKQEEPSDAPAASAPAVPAAAVTQASWAPEALEELVAPIALYPDQLLGQILAASVNAQEVLDAGNWLLENQNLQGAERDAAAQKVGFGPAMRALLPFPTVIDMMCQQIDWTRQVGSAFTSDQKAVLDAVQRLRAQAADVGNLQSTPEQTVERKTEDGEEFVEVKPADPTVVYVPQYDPQVVYTTPPPVVYTAPPPSAAQPATAAPAAAAPAAATTESQSSDDNDNETAGKLLAFGVGILVGTAIDDDDDYYYPHWGAGAVYYGARPYYPPAYAYRPVYGSGLRPAHHYAPGADYRYRHNDSRNVVINNNDYFNRFDNQQNLRAGEARSPLNATQQPANRGRSDRSAAGGRAESWKGKSTYAGGSGKARAEPRTATPERRSATSERKSTAPERKSAASERKSTTSERRSTTPERKSTAPERKSAAPERRSAPAARTAPAAVAGQGVRSSQAPARPTASPTQGAPDRSDRGYGTTAPVVTGGARTSDEPRREASSASTAQRDEAFSGASQRGSGSFDRAASARGNASAPAGRGRAGRRSR